VGMQHEKCPASIDQFLVLQLISHRGSSEWQTTGIGAQKSGLFPMLVSDYIYETTGKSRTPLRDTCKGEKSGHAT
jgi:hypothetical protein